MSKDCKNYGSSWCQDFECSECPVRDLKDTNTIITGMDNPTVEADGDGLIDARELPFPIYGSSLDITEHLKAQRDLTASIKDAEISELKNQVKELQEANDRQSDTIELCIDHEKDIEDAIASAVKAERQNIEEEKRETGYELLNYIENLYPHLHLYDDKNWISLKKEWLKKSR